jgi:hypothetical protein
MSKTTLVYICSTCGNANATPFVCHGQFMQRMEAVEVATAHQLIRRLELAIFNDPPLPPVQIFAGHSDSAWGNE